MKKKLMMVAMLLGALSLGACVDDNESASVTAIREAKKAQLESVAELNLANAEAVRLAAQAEADIAAAEARYRNALAAAAEAEAAEKEMLIEQAKEKFALELEVLKAQYEAQIAKFNKLKAQYEGELWDNVDDNTKAVYAAYTQALDNINTYTESKLEAQVRKSQAEAELVTAEESVKQTLAFYNKQLTQKENLLAKLQAMQEMQPSMEEYQKQLEELEKQAYDIVVNKKPEAEAAEKVAKDAYKDLTEAVTEGEYKFAAAAEALNEMASSYLYTQSFASSKNISIAEEERDAYYEEWGQYPDGTFNVNMYELTGSNVQAATLAADRAFEQKLADADDDIKEATGKEWEKDDDGNLIPGSDWTSVNGAKSAVAYFEQLIKATDKQIADKTKELNQAIEDKEPQAVIDQLKRDLEGLNSQKEGYIDSKEDSEVDVTRAEEYLAECNEAKAEVVEKQKEYKDNLTVLNDATALKEYQDAFATIEPKAVEYINAQAKVQPFDDALAEIGIIGFDSNGNITGPTTGQYQYIESLVNGSKDVAGLIDQCSMDIASIKKIIELGNLNELVSLQPVTKWIYNYVTGQPEQITVYHYVITGNTITAADAVAVIDAEIKVLEEKIRVETALAEKYKAELDDMLGIAPEA